MNKVSGQLQVYFEAPFWILVFEKVCGNRLSVCKVTYGAEPTNADVLEFILNNYDKLLFSPWIAFEEKKQVRMNPKRLQREIKKQLADVGIGTKSQQALKLQHEQGKQERTERFRKKQQAEKQHQFELKQQKKKEKHRGR